MGHVHGIYFCAEKGWPMQKVERVYAEAGAGLRGDRYSVGRGAFSGVRDVDRHISLIELEAIFDANREYRASFKPEDTRRNIVTRDVRLNELVGQYFRIGNVRVRGVELCDPCDRPSKLSGKRGFKEAFTNRGGLRVSVVENGDICVNDPIII